MGGGSWLRMLPLECCLCVVQGAGSVTGVSEDRDGTEGWSGAGSVMGALACSEVRSGAVGVDVEEGSEVEVEGQGWFLAWRSRSR